MGNSLVCLQFHSRSEVWILYGQLKVITSGIYLVPLIHLLGYAHKRLYSKVEAARGSPVGGSQQLLQPSHDTTQVHLAMGAQYLVYSSV